MTIRSSNNSRHIGSKRGGEGRQRWFASFAILYVTIHFFLSQASLSSYKTPAQRQSDEEKYYSSCLKHIRGAESSPTFKEDSSFCHRWDPSSANNRSLQPFDMWLTHHPTWVVSNETDEQFCVEPGNKYDHPYIRQQLQFYANQFHSSCDRVHIRTMWVFITYYLYTQQMILLSISSVKPPHTYFFSTQPNKQVGFWLGSVFQKYSSWLGVCFEK